MEARMALPPRKKKRSMTKDRKSRLKRRRLTANQLAKSDQVSSRRTRLPPKAAGRAKAPIFFTMQQVAEGLGVVPRTVQRWIKQGILAAHRFGTRVRVAESDLAAFLAV